MFINFLIPSRQKKISFSLSSVRVFLFRLWIVFLMIVVGFGTVVSGYYMTKYITQGSYESIAIFLLLIFVSNIVTKLARRLIV